MSVPSDSNIPAKEFEKLSKYKDLEIEIAKMWKMKTKTIPVIVGALRMIKKGRQKYVNKIPGNLSLAEIQKIVLLTFLEEPCYSKHSLFYIEIYFYTNLIQTLLFSFILNFLCAIFTQSKFTIIIFTKTI